MWIAWPPARLFRRPILNHAKPAELPVVKSSKFEIIGLRFGDLCTNCASVKASSPVVHQLDNR
jgi:hypothetical protein